MPTTCQHAISAHMYALFFIVIICVIKLPFVWSCWISLDAYEPEPWWRLNHVNYTSSEHHVCAYLVLVACCYDACKMPSCCFGQLVLQTCFACVCWTIASFGACSTWNLLGFACSFTLPCCILGLSMCAWCLNFASMPCLACFAHIF